MRKSVGLGGMALTVMLLAAPAEASVKDGVDAWSHGDFARAVAEWQDPAARGDADAEFNLAQAYKLGKGVPADLKKAEALYFQAAQQGHIQASDTYGLLLFQTGRREAALPWLTASAERGEPRAQYVMGIAHFNGDLVARDPVRAYALMTRAAASGLDAARATLASMDKSLSLAERQRGVALAADLESKANSARTAQLAAVGLGERGSPASPAVRVATFKGVVAVKPVRDTAGADYAKPVATSAPAASPPQPKAAPASKPTVSVPAPAPRLAATGAWRVQLGAFGVPGNAQALWGKLRGNAALAGRQPFFVPAGKMTKLQAGGFATRAEAQAACDRLGGQACIPIGG